MSTAVAFLIEEDSKTSEARRAAREMARDIGMDEGAAEHVAIVVTEACTNLLKHAGSGQVLVQTTTEGGDALPFLELLVVDRGPGMANLTQCLEDGYSTLSSPGQGLGAIQRLSQQSDIYSIPGDGTAILARWWVSREGAKLTTEHQIGGVNVSKPGEEVCGDAWGCVRHAEGLVILVADGLGHGMEAKLASREAVRQLYENSELPPKALLLRVHQALRSTRGAAVAVAQIDSVRHKLAFAGVGNISARIYAGSESQQNLVSLNGTAGQRCDRILEFSYPWPEDGLLALHSDGLSTSAGLEHYPGLAARDPVLIAAVLYRDFSRGHDDATVVVAKAA